MGGRGLGAGPRAPRCRARPPRCLCPGCRSAPRGPAGGLARGHLSRGNWALGRARHASPEPSRLPVQLLVGAKSQRHGTDDDAQSSPTRVAGPNRWPTSPHCQSSREEGARCDRAGGANGTVTPTVREGPVGEMLAFAPHGEKGEGGPSGGPRSSRRPARGPRCSEAAPLQAGRVARTPAACLSSPGTGLARRRCSPLSSADPPGPQTAGRPGPAPCTRVGPSGSRCVPPKVFQTSRPVAAGRGQRRVLSESVPTGDSFLLLQTEGLSLRDKLG